MRVTLAHVHGHLLDLYEATMQILETQNTHSRQLENLLATTTERLNALGASLDSIGTAVTKVSGETAGLVQAVADLKAIIEAGGANSPEIDAALTDVETKAASIAAGISAVDAQVEDVPAP